MGKLGVNTPCVGSISITQSASKSMKLLPRPKSVFKATLKRSKTGRTDLIAFEVPTNLRGALLKEIQKSPDFLSVQIGRPYKPRTTGDMSQNHKIAALINLITDETGYTYDEVKMQAKFNAIRQDYPYRWRKVWNPKTRDYVEQVDPYHENEIDTQQAAILISELQIMCAELGILV